MLTAAKAAKAEPSPCLGGLPKPYARNQALRQCSHLRAHLIGKSEFIQSSCSLHASFWQPPELAHEASSDPMGSDSLVAASSPCSLVVASEL